jgi:hypothetical protein
VNVGECTRAVIPKSARDAFHQLRLARAQFAGQRDHPSAFRGAAPGFAERFRFRRTMRNERSHEASEFVRRFVADQNAVARDNFADAAQFQFGKLFFPGIQQFHRVTAATVNSNSKSSPSVSAAANAGFAEGTFSRRAVLCRAAEMGIAGFQSSAPTPLAFKMCRKSPASPSLKSIIA